MNKSALKNATKGLAGAVALAGGSQAYGAVVSVTVPANIAANATTTPVTDNWDVNGDGIADFQITVGVYTDGSSFATSYAGITGDYAAYNAFAVRNPVVGYTANTLNYATRLANGATVGSTSAFVAGNYLTVLASRFNSKSYGQLRTRGFVGFSFQAADGIHYGYLDTKATVAGTGTTTVTNYSASLAFFQAFYQTTPGVAIVIGAVPEPTSLGALAFGGAGLVGAVAYRRKKAAKIAA